MAMSPKRNTDYEPIPIRGWGMTDELRDYQQMDEGFFKVGATIWMLGIGYATKVVGINEKRGVWIGSTFEGEFPYLLDELHLWTNHCKPEAWLESGQRAGGPGGN